MQFLSFRFYSYAPADKKVQQKWKLSSNASANFENRALILFIFFLLRQDQNTELSKDTFFNQQPTTSIFLVKKHLP